MNYSLFLFDLDDTLLDFRASEQLSFTRTLRELGMHDPLDALFPHYQAINLDLWRRFEAGAVTKDFLKVERFRRTFADFRLDLDPQAAARLYLESLPHNVVLVDGALALCAELAAVGEIGIITNGVDHIQKRRIASAGLGDYVSFIATSEACGHAKPDTRFFDYAAGMARGFSKAGTVIVGDRLDADILGANRFGIDSCWFNPARLPNGSQARPDYEVHNLPAVAGALAGA
jgi:2-haloacid dehalogenase